MIGWGMFCSGFGYMEESFQDGEGIRTKADVSENLANGL